MLLFLTRRSALGVILLALLNAVPLSAQLSTASVNGTVRDSTGSVIPNASVELRNQGTTVTRTATTNEAGVYLFTNVPPGLYTLQARKEGFSSRALEPFRLAVNQTATLDFDLPVGAVTESVTVAASAAEVQGSTSELGSVVTDRQVIDLPLNGRNFTQLLALTPGAAPVSVSQNRGGGFNASPTGGNFNFPAINGQTNRSNFFALDGIFNMEPFNSGYVVPPVVDSIQEFKVQSHNDQAEFGMVVGGTINVVTKSGTNQLHGAGWEYLRNDAFDARNTFLTQVQPLRQNQFGGAGGGPVYLPKLYDGRNRTFFFLSYQGWRFRQPAANFYRVPTPENLRGDLSDWPRQIFNPFTGRADPNRPGAFVRDPFPGNQIPGSLIQPGMVRFAQATLSTPRATGVADRNALDTTPTRQDQEEYSFKIDQTLSSRDFVWFRYSGVIFDTSRSGGREALSSVVENRAKNFGLSWVRTIGPTSTLQLQLGRVRTRQDTRVRFRNLPANFTEEVGWASSWAGGFFGDVRIVPGFNVAEFFSGNESDSLHQPTQVWQYKANYSKITGNHTFKFGGELASMNLESIFRLAASTFSTTETASPQQLGTTGSALASFLMNVPSGANRRNTLQQVRWGGVMGLYFTDQWKATRRLTVNVGLRYDRTFIPPYGRQAGIPGGIETGNYDLQRGVYILQKLPPPCAERGKAPCIPGDGKLPANVEVDPRGKLVRDTTKNFGPRFGLAYRLDNKTALRSGFGIVYDNWAGVMQTTTNSFGLWPDVAILNALNLNLPSAASPTPNRTGTNPFPGAVFPDPTPFNTVGWFFDPNIKNAYSMQWNFNVQRQVSTDMVATIGYVGSGTRRLDIGGTYNTALTPGPGDPAPRRPFPYIFPTFYDRSWGRSNYHGFQFDLDKKFTKGLVYKLAYTYAKSIDIACSGWFGVEGCAVQDPHKFNNERSVSGFDLRHVLNFNWVYELPVGRGKALSTGSRAGDFVIGNWQVNGIILLRSGLPYTLVLNGDIANTGNTGAFMRPNIVGDHKLSQRTPQRWFNTQAFAAPAAFTFGNAGRNIMRTDWTRNFDLSLFRQFRFSDTKSVEFRAEAFNAFNTPVYDVPVANLSSINFGRVLATENRARQFQLGLKILF